MKKNIQNDEANKTISKLQKVYSLERASSRKLVKQHNFNMILRKDWLLLILIYFIISKNY